MKYIASLVTLLVTGFAVAFVGAPAQAYPDDTLIVDAPAEVQGGDDVTITGTADHACESWTVTFNGQTQSGTGADIEATFPTPKVDSKTPYEAIVTCDDETRMLSIDVLPQAADVDDDADLPDTGGASRWMLLAGLALVIGGGGLVALNRRKHSTE